MTLKHVVTAEASVTSKNLSKVALLRVAQYPFLALFAFIVPRTLGPKSYGQYALFVSLVGMMSAFLDLGMTEIATRVVPDLQQRCDDSGIRTFFSRMLGFKVTINLTLMGICVLVTLLVLPHSVRSNFFWTMLLALFIGDLNASAYGLLFGLNKLAICSARDPIRRAASLAMVVALFHNFGLSGAIFSVVVVESVLAAINLGWTRHYFAVRDFAPNWRYTAPLLRYGLLFYVAWGITNVWQRLGNSLIGYLRGDFQQIALFDLSNQIFLTATGFTLFLITSLAPMFTRLHLEDKETKLIDWSRRILTYNQIACTVALGTWLLLGAELSPIMFGSQYGGLYSNVAVLLCGLFPMTVVQLGLTLAMAYAEPIRYLLSLGVALLSFVTMAFLLIPSHGALGCCEATLISCACCALTIGMRYRHNLRRSLAASFRAITMGGVIILPCWLLRASWARNVVLLVAFLVAYGALLTISRVVDRSEIREAWLALRHKPA